MDDPGVGPTDPNPSRRDRPLEIARTRRFAQGALATMLTHLINGVGQIALVPIFLIVTVLFF